MQPTAGGGRTLEHPRLFAAEGALVVDHREADSPTSSPAATVQVAAERGVLLVDGQAPAAPRRGIAPTGRRTCAPKLTYAPLSDPTPHRGAVVQLQPMHLPGGVSSVVRSDHAVADSALGEDPGGSGRVVSELAAELLHEGAYVLRVPAFSPHLA